MKMSLKWKFILAFTLIPLISLGIFFSMIYRNFKADRLAFIYETSLTQSRLLAKITAERISPISSLIEQWAEFYYRDPNYAETLIRTMRESSANLKIVSSAILIDYDPLLKKIRHTSILKWSPEIIQMEEVLKHLDLYRERLEKTNKPIIDEKLHVKDWTLLQKYKKEKNREIIILASFSKKWIKGRFAGQIVTHNFWVGDQGQLLDKNSNLSDQIIFPILKTIIQGKSTYGSFQFRYQGTDYITSYTIPNQAQLVMINLVKSAAAYEALKVILDQSLFLLGIIVCLAAILGVFLSKQLTQALEILAKATHSLGKGAFNIKLNIKTGDEIEDLSKSVSKMAHDIQHLMEETKHKGRMESELLLAREVQSTLFPPSAFDSPDIMLRGFSQSASECGGDWWTYFDTDTDFFVLVGDATGHGVPAALLTSAVNSLTALLSSLQILSPAQMLVYMNNALFKTSQGKKSMTMSLVKINKQTGLVRFANASHESPLILRDLQPQTRLNQLTCLESQKSNPIGFTDQSFYEEGEFQLLPNDTILLYTDGAIDARNTENQAWGERRFAKAIIESLLSHPGLDKPIQGFHTHFNAYTNGVPLIDDVTVILLKYKNTETVYF